jgi:hypothetical protein
MTQSVKKHPGSRVMKTRFFFAHDQLSGSSGSSDGCGMSTVVPSLVVLSWEASEPAESEPSEPRRKPACCWTTYSPPDSSSRLRGWRSDTFSRGDLGDLGGRLSMLGR